MDSLTRLRFGSVTPLGWIKDQIENDLTNGFAGCLDALTERAATDLWLNQIDSQSDQVAWWDAETRGNWVWGLTMASLLVGRQPITTKVRAVLDSWMQAQEPDGYLGVYKSASRYQHPPGEQGELWAQSRALLSLFAWAEAIDSAAELDSVVRAVDRTMRAHEAGARFFQAGENRFEGCGSAHGLCYSDVLQRLFEHTRDERYLPFAGALYREFSAESGWVGFSDLAEPKLNSRKAFSGHAVHTVEHFRCLIAAIRSGAISQRLLTRALKKLERVRLPNGAIQGDESIRGRSSPTVGYEYCTITELAMSLGEVGRYLGDASTFDWLERLVYSAGQGARRQDGKGIGYLTTDDQFCATAARPDAYSGNKPGLRYKISPTHEDVACCCNPNAVRLMPQFVADMWARIDDGFACCAFGPSQLDAPFGDGRVTIIQQTTYPHEDTIRFSISRTCSQPVRILVRVPQWQGEVRLEGMRVEPRGQWLQVLVDAIEAEFTVMLAPKIQREPYATGEVAILRGPVQFVQPIDGVDKRTKTYSVEGFFDFDVEPSGAIPPEPDIAELEYAKGRLVTKDGCELIPIGETTLRRAGITAG